MSHLSALRASVSSAAAASCPSHRPDMDPEVPQTLLPVRTADGKQRHITFLICGAFPGSRGTSGLQRRIHRNGSPMRPGCAGLGLPRRHPRPAPPPPPRRPQPPRPASARSPPPPPPPPPRRPLAVPSQPTPARAAHAELPGRAPGRTTARPPSPAPSSAAAPSPPHAGRPQRRPRASASALGAAGGWAVGWLRRVPGKGGARRRLPRPPQGPGAPPAPRQ